MTGLTDSIPDDNANQTGAFAVTPMDVLHDLQNRSLAARMMFGLEEGPRKFAMSDCVRGLQDSKELELFAKGCIDWAERFYWSTKHIEELTQPVKDYCEQKSLNAGDLRRNDSFALCMRRKDKAAIDAVITSYQSDADETIRHAADTAAQAAKAGDEKAAESFTALFGKDMPYDMEELLDMHKGDTLTFNLNM